MTLHRRKRWPVQLAVLATLGILFSLLYCNRENLSLDHLIRRQSELNLAWEQHPVATIAAAFLAYVAITSLPLPGSAALTTLVYGALFGFWHGVVIVSCASTAGAVLMFLISRFLFHEVIQTRFRSQLMVVNQALEREGAVYLLTLRLIPQIPFLLVNLVMGLTPIRLRTYWWVSQLGMLPLTCLYVYAGSTIGRLENLRAKGLPGVLTWQLAVAFTALGLFPLIVRRIHLWAVKRWKRVN